MRPTIRVLTAMHIFSVLTFAATLHVPGGYPTIQSAINAAVDGDTVLVAPHTYVENINFLGKGIKVISEKGPDVTIIDGGQADSVVIFNNNETLDSVIDGFTLTNGSGFDRVIMRDGGAIYCINSSPTIRNNNITKNTALAAHSRGGGIYCGGVYDAPNITGNVISDNAAYHTGGIHCDNCSPSISNNTITKNSAVYGNGGAIQCEGMYCKTAISGNYILINTAFQGGGIYSDEAYLTISGNYIMGNEAVNSGGGICLQKGVYDLDDNTITGNSAGGGQGGGILCWHPSDTKITNNIISNNFGAKGGGICCFDSHPTIKNNFIKGNNGGEGGGLCCINGASPVVESNHFSKNTALYGAGISCGLDANPVIVKNIIHANGADVLGGGIYCAFAPCTISCNTISSNGALESGGGLCIVGASPALESNLILNNEAKEGGGIWCDDCQSLMKNNFLSGNAAFNSGSGHHGGGMYLSYSIMTIINGTMVGNTANLGGGIFSEGYCKVTIVNSIFWEDLAVTGPEIYISDFSGPAVFTLSYSDVKGGQSSIHVAPGSVLNWGAGMIDADPLFMDTASGDHHILHASPCRDAGNSGAPNLPVSDFEGDPRSAYGTVDIGADEFYTHLYYTGYSMPGGPVEAKLIGWPGTSPVGLFIGSGVIDPPMPTAWGDFSLQAPWLFVPLAPIPSEGILVLPGTIPNTPPPPYDLPTQALIGMNSDSLTNLSILEVRF